MHAWYVHNAMLVVRQRISRGSYKIEMTDEQCPHGV